MKNRATSFRWVVLLVFLAAGSPSVGAQSVNPFDDVLGGLQEFSQSGSAAGNLVGLGLALTGNGPSQNPMPSARTAAAAEGMQILARLMEENGYDQQRAWIAFYQSPEGQRIMRVPGALALLTDWFNSAMVLPSGPQQPVNSGRADLKPKDKRTIQPTEQEQGEIAGTLTPPFLGPYRPNAYGPGINSDATGRPFVWQTDQGSTDPFAKVRPDVLGPGIGMDQYGRPVRAACPPYQPVC